MSKASDLMGRSGAPGPASRSPAPKSTSHPHPDEGHKSAANQGPDAVRAAKSVGGGGKAPIGRRPKV